MVAVAVAGGGDRSRRGAESETLIFFGFWSKKQRHSFFVF